LQAAAWFAQDMLAAEIARRLRMSINAVYVWCRQDRADRRAAWTTRVWTGWPRGSGRLAVAELVCIRSGHRSRLIYRTKVHRGRKGERRSFAETDCAALLDAAHQQLGGLIVLIWDDLNSRQCRDERLDRCTGLAARDPVVGLWAGPQPR